MRVGGFIPGAAVRAVIVWVMNSVADILSSMVRLHDALTH